MPKIMIKVQKKHTYHVPAGCFAGRCVDVVETTKQTTAGPIQQIRFRFQLTVAGINNSTPMAAVSLDLDLQRSSKLMRFLEGWLGAANINELAGGEFDLSSLNDRPVEVLLDHINNGTHEHPFVVVRAVYPPGTLRLTGGDAEEPELQEAA